MNNKYIVPAVATGFLGFMTLLLLVVVVVRPWGDHDNAWATHLNLTDEPLDGYSRSVQTFVSEEGSAPILVWEQKGCGDSGGSASDCDSDPAKEWIVRGCAGCHGFYGEGAAVGPVVQHITGDEFTELIRFGTTGMPAFDPLDLTDEHIALLAEYLQEMRLTNPVALEPTATPRPAPTPTAVAQSTPGGPAPTVPPVDDEVFALGKLVYDETAGGVGCAECHGLDGGGQGRRGGESAPNIKGATRSAVREALRGAFDMQDIDLTSAELAAVIVYMQSLLDPQ